MKGNGLKIEPEPKPTVAVLLSASDLDLTGLSGETEVGGGRWCGPGYTVVVQDRLVVLEGGTEELAAVLGPGAVVRSMEAGFAEVESKAEPLEAAG